MKTYRKIVFRITLLFAVIFCLGLNTYSHNLNQVYSIVITSNSNSLENLVSTDVDSNEDEQMSQTSYVYSNVETITQLVISNNSKLVHKHLFSIWQPPKFC